MQRCPLLLAALASLASAVHAQAPAPAAQPERLPLVHLQSDKGRCRLGDTLWVRVHLGEGAARAFPLRLALTREGQALAERRYADARALAATGELGERFLLDPAWAGGPYALRALGPGDTLLHELPLQVYATEVPALDVRVRVLGDLHEPGQTATASVRVTDRAGRPVAGARLRARASFGPLAVEQEAGPTDAEGWAAVRVQVPAAARGDGALSVGLEHGELLAASAAPVAVSASVGRIDAYPEGGAIVSGHAQRLALLARDLDGRPTRAEGRVLDDQGASVGTFACDRYGHALIDVPYAEGRTYRLEVTRPRVARPFPLPGDTGHAVSLRIERAQGEPLRVRVRARGAAPGARPGPGLAGIEVALASETAFLERRGLEGGAARFEEPELLRVRWVVVERKGRALLKAPLVTGRRWPFAVTVEPLPDQALLPGRPVQVRVRTTFQGRPVAADLALSAASAATRDPRDDAGSVPALAARALLQPCVHDGWVRDGADLFDGALATWERRHAYLLVRGGYALPPEGVALVRGAPPAAGVGRTQVPTMAPRPALEVPVEEGKTKRRRTGLDRLLERAPWTRPGPARSEAARAEPAVQRLGVARKRSDEVPGFGQPARRGPQGERVGWRLADTRDTFFWQARVRTDAKGEATVGFVLGHELAPLSLEAQGLADGMPLVGRGELRPRPEIETTFDAPEVVRLGDVIELWVSVTARDGQRLPYALEVAAPTCLEALERTRVELDPRRHGARTKFRFRARELAEGEELAVVVRRGLFEEVHRRPLQVRAAEPLLSVAAYGSARSTVEASLTIPRDALPGSVRAEARVSPSRLSTAVEGLESILREPHGCFEQTTSSNYPNLLVLEALLANGADAALLERAYALATTGFERIKTFQHPGGGFSLWGPAARASGPDGHGGEGEEARYTAMGAMQLARYAALFAGKGRIQLQAALDWLERHDRAARAAGGEGPAGRARPARRMRPEEHLFAAFAVADTGHTWSGIGPALELEPQTDYERALQANVLLSVGKDDPRRRARLDALLDALAGALEAREEAAQAGKPAPCRAGREAGQGVMHSVGEQLAVETAALALVAFAAEGREAQAGLCERFLLARRDAWGGWRGTQATALAIRALATGACRSSQEAIPVVLRALGTAAAGRGEGLLGAGRQRPLQLSRALPGAEPGASVRLALAFDSERELPYTLSCTYRVASVRSAPDSPYLLHVSSPAVLDAGAEAEVVATIRRRPDTSAPRGQVVALIQLAGGLRPRLHGPAGLQLASVPGLRHVEQKDGAVVLYWTEPPLTAPGAPRDLTVRIPVTGVAEGRYRAAPSVIYPYYASGLEAYAQGRDLRVTPAGSSAPNGAGPAGQATQAGQAVGAGSR